MLISHNVFTDKGKVRERNEDFVFADDILGIYMVCDGMGGHAAGDLAARTAVKSVTDELQLNLRGLDPSRDHERIVTILKLTVLKANSDIQTLIKENPSLSGMGTTLTLCIILNNQAIMAHVGDSRLYLLRNKQLQQLSKDHTFFNEMVNKDLLSEEEASASPYANMLMRAIGPLEAVEVDTLSFELLDNDRLLLCTDGVHGCPGLAKDEIRFLMEKDNLEAASNASEELVKLANERDGSDNLSAIIVYVDASSDDGKIESTRSQEVFLKIETLLDMYLFRGLHTEEILKVIEIVEVADIPAGKEVILEGERSTNLYIILSGSVNILKNGAIINSLKEKNHFGEMALLSQKSRIATVTAATDCRLLCIKADDFFKLIRQEHLLGVKVMWNIASELSSRLDSAQKA